MATYSFAGKRVLVTGGANGVGKEIVKRFLGTGATVIAADRDDVGLKALKTQFPQEALVTVVVDLSNWKVTTEVIEKLLPIHHLVNNAGIAPRKEILDVTESEIDEIFSVNFKAAFNLSQIFVRGVKAHGISGGTIVHISSVIDRIAAPKFCTYSCSKAALTMLSKSLASEFGHLKIRSNVVRPDLMQTDMFKKFAADDPEGMTEILKGNQQMSKLKKNLEPSDLCQLVLFLSSEDSSMITGVDIVVDGGVTLG